MTLLLVCLSEVRLSNQLGHQAGFQYWSWALFRWYWKFN